MHDTAEIAERRTIVGHGARAWLDIARQAREDGDHDTAAAARIAVRLLLRAHREMRPGPMHTVPTLAEHLDQLAADNGWTREENSANDAVIYSTTEPKLAELTLFRRAGLLDFAFTHRARNLRTIAEITAFLTRRPVPFVAVATDWNARPRRTVELPVAFTKRRHGGWYVNRADNGRRLGWIVQTDGTWDARVEPEAYKGTGPNDTGYILDHVENHYYNGDGPTQARPISYGLATRHDAADAILDKLVKHAAPAAGWTYETSHYGVTRWADR